ncbi:MAG: CAP domain-containing protein [Desulfovibrio sp.]|nr:CAP domain-containing protein [Desulfovibrio sp.]
MTQINNASDLIRNINAGSKFELAGNGQIKTQGWLSSFLQGIRDKFRSAATINARQARLDDAMANMLRSSEPMPDITQPNLYQAQTKISPAFAKTLEQIQSRLYAPQPSTTNTTSWQPQPQFQPQFQFQPRPQFQNGPQYTSFFSSNTGIPQQPVRQNYTYYSSGQPQFPSGQYYVSYPMNSPQQPGGQYSFSYFTGGGQPQFQTGQFGFRNPPGTTGFQQPMQGMGSPLQNAGSRPPIRNAAPIANDFKGASANEKRGVELLNSHRARHGLPPLRFNANSPLQQAARLRAQELTQIFSHMRPDGRDMFSVLRDHNIQFKTAGENIAYGTNMGPDGATEQWIHSPGHNQNMLNPAFEEVGLASFQAPNGNTYWVQVFNTPMRM